MQSRREQDVWKERESKLQRYFNRHAVSILGHVFFILILVTFDLNYGALSLGSGNLDASTFLSQK